MNNIAHQKATQDAVRKRFRGHNYLYGKSRNSFPAVTEREYQRILNQYMSLLNATVKDNLPNIINALRSANTDSASTRYDGTINVLEQIRLIFSDMFQSLEKRLEHFALELQIEKIADMAQKRSKRAWKKEIHDTLGIDILEDYYSGDFYGDMLRKWVRSNVGLIRTLPQESLQKMEDIVLEGYLNGKTITTLSKEIQKEYGMAKRHAKFIATDQIAKLNSKINEAQQRDAGVEEYYWRTVHDERVRSDHAKLDGKVFRWDDPPIINTRTGERGHPGDDYGCRCQAIPKFSLMTVDLPFSPTNDD